MRPMYLVKANSGSFSMSGPMSMFSNAEREISDKSSEATSSKAATSSSLVMAIRRWPRRIIVRMSPMPPPFLDSSSWAAIFFQSIGPLRLVSVASPARRLWAAWSFPAARLPAISFRSRELCFSKVAMDWRCPPIQAKAITPATTGGRKWMAFIWLHGNKAKLGKL